MAKKGSDGRLLRTPTEWKRVLNIIASKIKKGTTFTQACRDEKVFDNAVRGAIGRLEREGKKIDPVLKPFGRNRVGESKRASVLPTMPKATSSATAPRRRDPYSLMGLLLEAERRGKSPNEDQIATLSTIAKSLREILGDFAG